MATPTTPTRHFGDIAEISVPWHGDSAVAFEFRCGACAEVASFTVLGLTLAHRRGHADYMARKEADEARRAAPLFGRMAE